MNNLEKTSLAVGLSAGAGFTAALYGAGRDNVKSIGLLGLAEGAYLDLCEHYIADATLIENLSSDPYFAAGYIGGSAATIKALNRYHDRDELREIYEELDMEDMLDELE